MLIIWGSKSLKKSEMTINSECVVCTSIQPIAIISYRTWFTFFFIPIFPTSRKKIYLECMLCENTYTIKDETKIKELLKKEKA